MSVCRAPGLLKDFVAEGKVPAMQKVSSKSTMRNAKTGHKNSLYIIMSLSQDVIEKCVCVFYGHSMIHTTPMPIQFFVFDRPVPNIPSRRQILILPEAAVQVKWRPIAMMYHDVSMQADTNASVFVELANKP